MFRTLSTALLFTLLMSNVTVADHPDPDVPLGPFSEADWPWWRGQQRNGTASSDQQPPLTWGHDKNVIWKAYVPGRGHGSPIVVGSHVVLATADEKQETRSVLCLERATGATVWSTVVHDGDATPARNERGTQASSTVACDGQRYFINFLHDGAMVTSALGLDGKVLWQNRITDYVVHQGYGSSPAIYKNLVLVSADNKTGGAIAGLERSTGKVVWRHERPEHPNYPSPIVLTVAGRDQLVMTGCDRVTSLDPLTGKQLWETAGATTECVTSTLTDGDLVFSSGGYPRNHVAAYRAENDGELIWENGTRVYVPSMLIRDGYLYAVADAGIAVCWEAATGKEMWKSRLRGTVSSSPVLVGDRIYVTNEAGETFVFRAQPDKFEQLARNEIAGECFATPVICDSRIYTRIAHTIDDERREYLYCLGSDSDGRISPP